jgi:hypothetical protein
VLHGLGFTKPEIPVCDSNGKPLEDIQPPKDMRLGEEGENKKKR